MRYLNSDLNDDVVSSYDKTKTTIQGRVYQDTIGGVDVLKVPGTGFIDVITDTGALVAPGGLVSYTANGRVFVLGSFSGGLASLVCYSFNSANGSHTYLGRVVLAFPNSAATTHTMRAMRVFDSGTTGWKVVIATIGTVAINGGLMVFNKIDLSDFTTGPSPITIQRAISNDAKGGYFYKDPVGLGVANNTTTLMGMGLDASNSELIVTNGTAASFNTFGFNLALAPTLPVFQATTQPSVGTPTFAAAGHTFAANDPVCLVVSGGTAPGGFTAATTTTHQVYFVRNPVAGVSFELSITSGGSAINSSGLGTGTITTIHAFGQSTNSHLSSRKSGTIASGFVGTALLLDNQKIVTPTDSVNAGNKSYFFATSSNFYNFRLTDITAGATTLPTATGINQLGNGTDIVSLGATLATYSESLGKTVYMGAAFNWLMKSWVNNTISHYFGTQVATFLENDGKVDNYFRAMAATGIEERNGFLLITNTTAGQRGVIFLDLRSDSTFDYSFATTKILQVGPSTMRFITTLEQDFELTDYNEIYYRTAATSSDPVFNSISGGWTLLDSNADLSANSLSNFIQFKIMWKTASLLSGNPAKIEDIVLGYDPVLDNSQNWNADVENSTKSIESPGRSAAILIRAYSSSVPKIRMIAYSRATGLPVRDKNTVDHPAEFQYSANSGTSWNALGTIPNTINTTRLRYNWGSPIPEDVDIVWIEG